MFVWTLQDVVGVAILGFFAVLFAAIWLLIQLDNLWQKIVRKFERKS